MKKGKFPVVWLFGKPYHWVKEDGTLQLKRLRWKVMDGAM